MILEHLACMDPHAIRVFRGLTDRRGHDNSSHNERRMNMDAEHTECPHVREDDGPHTVEDGDGETVEVPTHALL